MVSRLGANSGEAIDATCRWGRVWARLGHAHEAAQEIGKIVDVVRKTDPRILEAVASWVLCISYAYVLNLDNQPRDAEIYGRATLLCLKHAPSNDARRAEALCETGVALVLQRRFHEAIPMLQESRQIYLGLPGWGPNNRQTQRASEFLAKAQAGQL